LFKYFEFDLFYFALCIKVYYAFFIYFVFLSFMTALVCVRYPFPSGSYNKKMVWLYLTLAW